MFLNKYLISTVSLIRTCRSKSSISVSWRGLTLECLKKRSILKVSGEETQDFMQGLITNDMQHLEDGACSMYTMFLNNKGRVMYDAIIYRTPVKNAFLIECDLAATEPLKKHMSMFRIRRKIVVDTLSDDVSVWIVFHPLDSGTTTSRKNETHSGRIVPCNTLNELQTIDTKNSSVIQFSSEFCNKHNLIVCRDPRLITLGVRVIAPKSVDFIKLAAEEIGAVTSTDQQVSYKALRYRLGVGEGIEDLPPGNCFPLEANCDYLHGVSFHKGCYIGQELTARTHHTGVVRKRLMPIVFDEPPTTPFVPDTPIERGDKSRPIGKLRGIDSVRGLALLRITEALETEKFKVLNVNAQTMKPAWWPQEATKDRALAGKDTAS